MFTYPSGREVYLTKLMIVPTYEGCMEGRPEQYTKGELDGLPEKVREHMPPGRPVVVLHSGEDPLLDWIWIAGFESGQGVKTDDPDFNSRLFICWFTSDVMRSIPEEIGQVLKRVDWESNAENYDITLF